MVFLGSGMVWDAQKGKMLCKFQTGRLETEDDYVIKKLLEYGYKSADGDEVVIFDAPEETVIEDAVTDEAHIKCGPTDSISDNYTDDELRQLAKENGVKSWHNKKIENIVEELKSIDVLIA